MTSHFGLLNLNKPSGVTSRRVVDGVVRQVRPAKVGHAGTLDPLASGVLVVGVGSATRLVEYLHQMPKRYRATFLLGRASPTEDVESEVTMLAHAVPPSRERLEDSARKLVGDVLQRPPAFSALKIGGRRAYALARSGQEVELAPRAIHIHRLEIVHYEYPELCLDIECGSGTYVRSLGRDLAERAGTGAVMSALTRTAIGCFTLEAAIDPDTLSRYNIADHLLPAVLAVRGLLSEQIVSEEQVKSLSHGLPIAASEIADNQCAAVDSRGRLVAILTRRSDGRCGPSKFFSSS